MTDEDIAKTATLLKQLKPGLLPYDIFIQIARLSVLSIIEIVPLQYINGRVEVLLLERHADDPIWSGQLHSPGTVVRPTDSSLTDDAFRRIVHDELKGTQLSKPQFVESLFRDTERGKENVQVFWAEILETPRTGSLYAIDDLPSNFILSQEGFIRDAAKSFRPSA